MADKTAYEQYSEDIEKFKNDMSNLVTPNFDGYSTLDNFRRTNTRKEDLYDFTNEPTFLTFSISFDFMDDNTVDYDPETFIPISPLLDIRSNVYNAYTFLRARNRSMEANLLKNFVKKLKSVSKFDPWMFRRIDGLPEIWKAGTDMSKPFKDQDKKLKITTYESLDLSIAYLADLYRLFALDQKFMRSVLPDNLRWFTFDVYVCEFRNLRVRGITYDNGDFQNKDFFRKYDSTDPIKSPKTGEFHLDPESHYNWFKAAKTYHHYKFNMCEFDFSETVPYSTLAIDQRPDMAENVFSIKPGWNMEYNHYDLQTVFNSCLDYIGPENVKFRTSSTFDDLDQYTRDVRVFGEKQESFNSMMNKFNMQASKAHNSIMGIVDTYNNIKDLDVKDILQRGFNPIASTIDNINDIFSGKKDSDEDGGRGGRGGKTANLNPSKSVIEPYDPDEVLNTTSPEELATKSEDHIHNIKTKVGIPTTSSPGEQEFKDVEPDVAMKEEFEVEFPDVEPIVTVSDSPGQEFPDVEPDVAAAEEHGQEFPDTVPDVAMKEEFEVEFPDVEPDVAMKEEFEVEFPDVEPIVTAAKEYDEKVFGDSGNPTNTKFPDGHEEIDNMVLSENRTAREEYDVEKEFKSPGEPTKSIFDKIIEKENEVLTKNVTKSDVTTE